MDSLRLALRFRNSTPGIDTIREHRSLIGSKGSVWWGWWKKDFEPSYSVLFKKLIKEGSGYLYLIDKSEDKSYKAHYTKVLRAKSNQLSKLKVPKYYRDQINNVAGWFLLDEIEEINYLEDISQRIGNSTLLVLDYSEEKALPSSSLVVSRVTISRQNILHLTDLHFGSGFGFIPPKDKPLIGDNRYNLTKCIYDDLKRVGLHKDIGLILITGDFTTNGNWTKEIVSQIISEIENLCNALNLTKDKIITLPGNHDVVRYPKGTKPKDIAKINVSNQTRYKHENKYRAFIEKLTGRNRKEPLNFITVVELSDLDVVICALNSCAIAATNFTEYGYVGDIGQDVLKSVADIKYGRPSYRILAIHHHLIPVNTIEEPSEDKPVSITLDAVKLLNVAQSVGIHLSVHGHQHIQQVVRYEQLPLPNEPRVNQNPMIIISGGSTGANLKSSSIRNSYAVLKFDTDGVRLLMRELRTNAEEGANLFDAQLPIQAVV